MWRPWIAGSILILAPACEGSQRETPSPDAAAAHDDAAPRIDAGPEPVSLGEFEVLESSDKGMNGAPVRRFSQIHGVVREGPAPLWQHESANDGTCRLLSYTPSFCDPACSSELCVDGTCQPYPRYLDAGRVTIGGLAGPDVSMEAEALYHAYKGPFNPPVELFADDAVVTLSAPGAGAVPAFQAETRGVPALVTEIQGFVITLKDSEDFVLRWTPADDPDARVRVTLQSRNDGHGLPFSGVIECDAPDDAAEIVIPRAMIAAFPATDNWEMPCLGHDCPRSWIRRYQRSYALVPGGGIALVVGSQIDFGVVHRR